MTERARKLLDDAMVLSELEHRARRARAAPEGGEAWDVVKRRIEARKANR